MNKKYGYAIGILIGLAVVWGVTLALFRYFGGESNGVATKLRIRDEFVAAMNTGKNYLESGEAPKAVTEFQRAASLHPGDRDALLNLANSLLAARLPEEAIEAAGKALAIDRNSSAGYYLAGCARLRLGRFEEAVQYLQIAKDRDRTINAVSFQLGRAHQGLQQFEAAEAQFREVTQFDPEHRAAWYNLSQALIRLGDEAGAEAALAKHQELAAQAESPVSDPSVFEQCVYTEVQLPFALEQPDSAGVPVRFVEATTDFLGDWADRIEGPVGVLDLESDGALDLFVRDREEGFRLLVRRDGEYVGEGLPVPAAEDQNYSRCLVGNLQQDARLRQDNIVLLGEGGTRVFRVATGGLLLDVTRASRLGEIAFAEAWLTDFELTGKLDLLGLDAADRSLTCYGNRGNLSFLERTAEVNLPPDTEGLTQLALEDWDGDDLLDLCLLRSGTAPQLWLRQRGEIGFVRSEAWADLTEVEMFVLGDVNNDLRSDLVAVGPSGLTVKFQGAEEPATWPLDPAGIRRLRLFDYDNDGWLDILAVDGNRLRAWRNRGLEGFTETTEALGLDRLEAVEIDSLRSADLDGDCDSDLLLTLADRSLRVLRNDGGHQNRQLKIRLIGNRSNPSGLGIKLELAAGGLRLIRTVQELPIEIGLGDRDKVDSLNPHWSDLVTTVDVMLDGCDPIDIMELELPTGSCPYLYAWDGEKYRFVTDFLGASPLGLPVAPGVLIPADTDEFVRLNALGLKEGHYELQVTEELREALYLDEAALYAVDRPLQVEVHPVNRLMPRPPFPEAGLIALHNPLPLEGAVRSDGLEVRSQLSEADGVMASPVALRAPQFRGLAQPWHIDLDFGPIDPDRPLALMLHGWLRFGGGMANISAAHRRDFPFPFPVLFAELEDGTWQKLEVEVGAPAGKTKTMAVDLEGHLPAGLRRLRLATAFEIHWDRIALLEKYDGPGITQRRIAPSSTDLHWRGYSEFQDLPWDQPLSPDYEAVRMEAPWLLTLSGWCTRYGPVDELLAAKDDRLVILNGGDELTLRFEETSIPELEEGKRRDFFLFTSGWDKDADPHVVQGWTIEPLPWHGMDGQRYGQEPRPASLDDGWRERYNTRWVGPYMLRRPERADLR